MTVQAAELNRIKQFCKDKGICSRCMGCNPEGFYMDGELSEEQALKEHGGKYTYCTDCASNYQWGGGNVTWWREWERNAIICESC